MLRIAMQAGKFWGLQFAITLIYIKVLFPPSAGLNSAPEPRGVLKKLFH